MEKRKDAGNPPTARSSPSDSSGTITRISDAATTEEAPSSRRRGHKRKSAGSSGNGGNASTAPTTSSKRQAREKPSATVFYPPIHNGPLTRARQSPTVETVVINEVEAEMEKCLGGRQVVKASGEICAVDVDREALVAKIEAEYEVIRSRDANAHAVPIPAGWFSWTRLHPLEEQAMPSFFNVKSETRTPEMYMEIRNWIMRKYHANPNTQIELKDLSEVTIGELDATKEVMEFLDHWGLINYHPFPESDSAMNPNGDGEAKIDSLIEKLYRFETEQSCPPVVPTAHVMTPSASSGVFPESSVAEELARTEEEPSVEYHCNSCSGDCSRRRYHCQKQADFDLCTECFNNGKFDSDMSPTDFILMEPAEAAGLNGGKWTDQETLLLLEAIELYKENWNEIAEHVATKTKTQCILHFVQMPIEETFMDRDFEIDAGLKENADQSTAIDDSNARKVPPETIEPKTGGDENQPESSPMEISKPEDASEVKVSPETNENCALKALKEAFEAVGSLPMSGDQFSFTEAGNPVMALAAFLVRLVEPSVAAAFVGSSLKSISGNSSSTQLAMLHCFLLEDPPDDKKKSADSESHEKNSDSVRKRELSVSPEGGVCTEKSLPKDVATMSAEELKADIHLSSAKDSGDCISDLPNEAAERSTKESDYALTPKVGISSSSTKERALVEENNSYSGEAAKDLDSLCSENKEPKQMITSNSATENGRNTGEEDCKNENKDILQINDYYNIDKVKRAAVTALSAAAVKAKLLADQEEDQIRQLATSLVDKQLHKLETKLAFFSEMECAVMRVREQMERSKQRLYQERAQIIASRMGFSVPSSRLLMQQQSVPINRGAMGFANSAAKPPMTTIMTSQRPPISRSMLMSSLASNTSPGNPTRPE